MTPLITQDIFYLFVSVALLLFLWSFVLAKVNRDLKIEDHSMGKYILLVVSLPIFGLSIHCVSNIIRLICGSTDPL